MNPGSHNHIWEQVKVLLHEHDCVILPAFGGFVCNREPARIDQVSHTLLPPGKRLVFNQNLRTNDGLLAGKLAEKNGITYAEALRQIEELVNYVVGVLNEKKQLQVDAFGSFRLNAEANYVFLPERQNSYLTSSFGLKPLQADHLKPGGFKEKRTRIFKERKPVKAAGRRKTSAWPKVLVAVLLVMLGVNGWIFFRENPQDLSGIRQASLNVTSWFDSIFNTNDSVAATPPAPVVSKETEVPRNPDVELIPENPLTAEPDRVNAIDTVALPLEELPVETAVPVFDIAAFGASLASAKAAYMYIPHEEEVPLVTPEQPSPEPVEHVEPVPHTAGGPYHIIGGVFCKNGNAEHFKEALIRKGYHASVVINHSINCKRVSYASFSDRSEAERVLRQIQQQENPEAWLLVEN